MQHLHNYVIPHKPCLCVVKYLHKLTSKHYIFQLYIMASNFMCFWVNFLLLYIYTWKVDIFFIRIKNLLPQLGKTYKQSA